MMRAGAAGRLAWKKARSFIENNLALREWWSWGDLNPRPQAFVAQIYMFSGLIWISLPESRSRTLNRTPVPYFLVPTQDTRIETSPCNYPCSREASDCSFTPLPSPSANCCKAHWQLSSECETFVVCS